MDIALAISRAETAKVILVAQLAFSGCDHIRTALANVNAHLQSLEAKRLLGVKG